MENSGGAESLAGKGGMSFGLMPTQMRPMALKKSVKRSQWLITAIAFLSLLWLGKVAEGEQKQDDREEAQRLTRQVLQLEQQGKYTEALPLAQQAVAIYEKVRGTEHPETAMALDSLSSLYREMGDYAHALPLAQRALAMREKALGSTHPDTATSLNNLALIYQALGNNTQALPLFQRAVTISEQTLGAKHSRTAIPLGNLAALYQALGDYTHALPLFQRALAIRERTLGPEHPRTAIVLGNLATLYQTMGDYTHALPLFQRALAIREKVLGPEHPKTATSLSSLASLYREMGDYTRALPLAQRAVTIHEQVLGSAHPDTAASLYTVAAIYRDMEDYPQALQFTARCLSVQDQVFSNVFAATSETQKLLFVQKSQEPFFLALSLIRTHFLTDPAAVRLGLELVLRRKGAVLDAQSRTQQALAGELHGDALQSWQRLTQARSTLAHLLLRGPEQQPPTEYREAVAAQQTTIAREETFLAQQSSTVAQALTHRKVTARLLAARLPRDGILIEFVHLRDFDEQHKKWSETWRYLAFVLTPENQVHVVDLGDAQEIDTQIEKTLSAINISHTELVTDLKAAANQADAALATLAQKILQPLAPYMGTFPLLIVSPDGELNRVPFAALRTPDDRYLIEHVTLVYVASGRDFLQERNGEPATVDLLLVANPDFDNQHVLGGTALAAVERAGDFDRGFAPLPGTAQEAEAIPPLLSSAQKPLQQAQATEFAVRAVRSPKILHLATHGFFLENEEIFLPTTLSIPASDPPVPIEMNPMVRSGLALAGANHAREITRGDDGLLTALEVTSMDLRGTDLVVLSACETGRGKVQVGEGVYGLRRAFTLAGAKNLLMSLWKANDLMTLYQMKVFYRAYRNGKSAAEALREAQLRSIASLRAQTRASYGEELAPVKLWATFLVQQTAAEDAKHPVGKASSWQWVVFTLLIGVTGGLGVWWKTRRTLRADTSSVGDSRY